MIEIECSVITVSNSNLMCLFIPFHLIDQNLIIFVPIKYQKLQILLNLDVSIIIMDQLSNMESNNYNKNLGIEMIDDAFLLQYLK